MSQRQDRGEGRDHHQQLRPAPARARGVGRHAPATAPAGGGGAPPPPPPPRARGGGGGAPPPPPPPPPAARRRFGNDPGGDFGLAPLGAEAPAAAERGLRERAPLEDAGEVRDLEVLA